MRSRCSRSDLHVLQWIVRRVPANFTRYETYFGRGFHETEHYVALPAGGPLRSDVIYTVPGVKLQDRIGGMLRRRAVLAALCALPFAILLVVYVQSHRGWQG